MLTVDVNHVITNMKYERIEKRNAVSQHINIQPLDEAQLKGKWLFENQGSKQCLQ